MSRWSLLSSQGQMSQWLKPVGRIQRAISEARNRGLEKHPEELLDFFNRKLIESVLTRRYVSNDLIKTTTRQTSWC